VRNKKSGVKIGGRSVGSEKRGESAIIGKVGEG